MFWSNREADKRWRRRERRGAKSGGVRRRTGTARHLTITAIQYMIGLPEFFRPERMRKVEWMWTGI
jgi:hypothetical protein